MAVLVVPSAPQTTLDEENVVEITTGRYMQVSALAYLGSVITLQIARHFYSKRLELILDAFYRQVQDNYLQTAGENYKLDDQRPSDRLLIQLI